MPVPGCSNAGERAARALYRRNAHRRRDAQRTDLSSSSLRVFHIASRGRLNGDHGLKKTLLSHVSTAGGGAYIDAWVSSFKLSHSLDGISWQWYTEPGHVAPHVFLANTDSTTVVRHRIHGNFLLTSIFAKGIAGHAKLRTPAPLLTRFLRIFPVTWNGTKIALRFDVLRRLECGDGFWDEMHEKCDDGNVVSGDGCSGTSGEWKGTPGPCMK